MEAMAATAEAGNGKPSESTPDPKKKKRKRRKKKQGEMVASGNEAEIGGPFKESNKNSDQQEDANESFDLEDEVSPVKESEERDIQVSTLEKVKSKSSFVDEGIKDPVAVESEVQEAGEDGQPPTKGDERYNDLNEEIIPSGEDEKPPLVLDEAGGSSTPETVTDRETAKSATITTTVDGAADEPAGDSSSRNLPIGDDVESDTDDDSCDLPVESEGRNVLCIYKLIYGVGLEALRNLFMDINPTWSNQPSDAAALDRGKMKLTKDDEVSFNKGNIQGWDFSLITSILLFSNTCAPEMKRRPGYDFALKELKKCRNKVLGHPSTDKMSDADFNHYWHLLSTHFRTVGADPNAIAEIKLQSDEVLTAGGYYKDLFLTEQAKINHVEKKLDELASKLETVLADQSGHSTDKSPTSPKDLSDRKWDDWLKFCDAVSDFDTRKNQYILVTDALSPENLDYFSILRRISWKMVVDFDTMSEEKGFYHSFTSQEGQGSLVSMITPAEMKGSTIVSLARQIDPSKTQWLFVKGRSSDTDGNIQSFEGWESSSVKEISRFFGCCCDPDKFDRQKPVVCVVLPFCQESVPYMEVTLSRLFENFGDQFRLQTVSFKQEKRLSAFSKVKVRTVELCPRLFHLGLKEMLTSSSESRYRMPTSQAKVYVDLTEKELLYLNEHLDILFEGCEGLPEVSDNSQDEEQQIRKFLDEHRQLFMSGHEISFASLYDNHDAKREIEKDIQIHVQRVLDNGLKRPMMVVIRHLPGTGGTTIARRVMWDLHKAYPCAFIDLSSHMYFEDGSSYANKVADRIAALEEICQTSPVILVDGKQSGSIESIANKTVRMLGKRGKRALLLCCQHGSKTSTKEHQELSWVHHVFYVDAKLEDSMADLNEFDSKYAQLIEKSSGEKPVSGLCRVFHFPLLAMMQKFRPKLKKIIDDTWNEMEDLQQQIAIVVAFLQKYANQPTPALLLYDAFKGYIRLESDKTVTYDDIKRLFSEHLLNLMVPSNPWQRRGKLFHSKESPPESYTLQHRVVAEMLMTKCFQEQGCDLFQVVGQFLEFPIYERDNREFLTLFLELFVYNKDFLKKLKFSVLFVELKSLNAERASRVFCEAAEKTGDSVIFANAARFFAKMDPPLFSKAMALIEQAFEANTSGSKQRLRSICHTKGVVLYFQLRYMISTGRVKDLQKLEGLASKVLEAYKEARDFPPTYPNPLIGEVEVWLACLEWIMKNICERDSEKTLKFLANQCPPFFRTCVSDSFYLLDIVDGIVLSVPTLPDPEDTQRRCNNNRLALMKSFGTGFSSTGRGRDAKDVVQACKALCCSKNFPRASALELKKLQAHFILNSSDQIDSLKQENLEFLLKLLEEIVFQEHQHRLAYHLMKVCVLVSGPQGYSLEQGLTVCEKWLEVASHDCLPYFYQMVIYFLKILDGHVIEFMPKYLKALKMCRDKSQNHCRSSQATLFVGKEGIGMSRLVTRSTLFRGETDYSTDVSETVTRFWLVDNRKKLLECRGRIRVEPSSDRGKTYPYIELLQGKVALYVGKNADIGKVERDFNNGQLVYFVVSFNLQGPVANGITFSPHTAIPRQKDQSRTK